MEPYIFKTVEKTFTNEVDETRTIVGIQAAIVERIEISLKDDFHRMFYIAFELATGGFYGQRNASTNTFIQKLVDGGMPLETAKNTIKNLVKMLEYGTKEQIYACAVQLAEMYGYELLPIEQQPGQEPTPSE